MNVGDLYDLIGEKLKSGELSRMDNVYTEDEVADLQEITEVVRIGSCTAVIRTEY